MYAAIFRSVRGYLVDIGRWLLTRLARVGAKKLVAWMRKRALGYQTDRLNAAIRTSRSWAVQFRRGQIERWLAFAWWLEKNAKRCTKPVVDELARRARAAKIPVTGPLR